MAAKHAVEAEQGYEAWQRETNRVRRAKLATEVEDNMSTRDWQHAAGLALIVAGGTVTAVAAALLLGLPAIPEQPEPPAGFAAAPWLTPSSAGLHVRGAL